MRPVEIVKFWFDELTQAQWWTKDEAVDAMITERYSELHAQAVTGELYEWRGSALGRLAEVIIIDQFSRNMFRDSLRAFAYDAIALVLAQEAVQVGADQELSSQKRTFLYLPFMHSESALVHKRAVELFSQEGLEGNLDFENKHKVIIDRFGRYPHRNEVLGRESTAEEIEFLKGPGSSF